MKQTIKHSLHISFLAILFTPHMFARTTESESFTNKPIAGSMMHLLLGRSFSIHTQKRLTRIYVTNPTVLYAYTASPNQILVTSKQPGLSSVVIWDESGASQTYFISSDVDVTALRASIKEALPNENIHIAAEQEKILLTGSTTTPSLADTAGKLASLYSKDVSNAITVNSSAIKQVKLKVRIVEVDRSKLEQYGFNFFSAGGNNLAQTSTMQFPSQLSASTSGSASNGGGSGATSTVGNKTVAVTNPLNFLLYSSQLNVGAMLQDMQTKQILQILAEPTISTISGEKANFLAGGEFPFPVVQGTTGGLTSISIEFRPYGVRVEFLPMVNPDGSIQLKVAPEVSALDYTNAVNISGYTIPALSTRKAETQVVLKDGQSFAISGLLDRRTTDALSKTPGIASIPILGELFKSKSINHSTTELLVIVTPAVIDPLKEEIVPVTEPKTVVPTLDPQAFDTTLSKKKK